MGREQDFNLGKLHGAKSMEHRVNSNLNFVIKLLYVDIEH